jgi:hypothetical protein
MSDDGSVVRHLRNVKHFWAERQDFGGTVALYFATWSLPETHDALYLRHPQFELVPVKEGDNPTEPTLTMSEKQAVALMDSLWRAGVRPMQARKEDPDQLTAVKAHLQDMRAIAFAKTNVERP